MKNIKYYNMCKRGGWKIITETAVQKLVDQLYEYMSFKVGEEPHHELLKGIFHEEAVIIDYAHRDFRYYNEKNIQRHIEEINFVLSKDPVIKCKGFSVKELNNTIYIAGPTALVKSVYEKKYSDGMKEFGEIGINSMQIVRINDDLKIISMACFEK